VPSTLLREIVERVAHTYRLNEREKLIVLLTVRGRSTKEICAAAGCPPGTLSEHWRRIQRKSGLTSRKAIAAPLVEEAIRMGSPGPGGAQEEVAATVDRFARERGLTARDAEVLALAVTQGLSNKEIAARLDLSPRTVDVLLSRVFFRLGRHSRWEVIRAVLAFAADERRPRGRTGNA
jgi:DNA-binding CsgD family transcriptional regulator